jgi:hypothetical protein
MSFDAASGNYYDHARFYNAGIGMFDQTDYGYSGSLADPMTDLPYTFTGGDPINMLDLSGHFTIAGTISALSDLAMLVAVRLAPYAGALNTVQLVAGTATFISFAADPLVSGAGIGSAFQDYRNIRTLVELGTPNLGSPLANLVSEIYQPNTLGQTIANATVSLHGIDLPVSEKTVVSLIKSLLPTSANGSSPYPFFEDDAIDSPLLQQLNGNNPFNTGVSYAAIAGTDTSYQTPKFLGQSISLDLYADVQPLGPNGQSYFPWISTLDGAANDSIVPIWSAALPLQSKNGFSYDDPVNIDHTHLESNPLTEFDVANFLNNPNLPLGSAQRQAAGANGWQPPISDQNAYKGGSSGANGEVTGAGLNPDAIAGVRLDGSDYNTATWNLSATTGPTAGAGIKHPVLTGMVQKSQLENGISMSLVASSGGYDIPLDTLDTATVKYGDTGVYVDANAWAAAGPGDYVPFEISTLEVGRGLSQGVTGPSLGGVQDDSATGYALVGYTLGGIYSPTTQVNLPTYTPPAPAVISDVAGQPIQVQVEGAFQVTDATAGSSPTSYDVKLYDTSGDKLYEQDVSAASEPSGVWNGLALEFSPILLTFDRGSNNTIIAPDGFVLNSPANILQNFWESGVTSGSGYNSGTVEVQ